MTSSRAKSTACSNSSTGSSALRAAEVANLLEDMHLASHGQVCPLAFAAALRSAHLGTLPWPAWLQSLENGGHDLLQRMFGSPHFTRAEGPCPVYWPQSRIGSEERLR